MKTTVSKMDNLQVAAPSGVNRLLESWVSTANEYAGAHRVEAIALKKRHTRVGAPSVALSAVVGTTIFTAIQEAAQSAELKWLLALLSMCAAALAALVTFYNFAERSARHRIASEEYEDIARRLDVLRTSISTMLPTDWRNVLDGYSQRLEAIGRRADLPDSMAVVKEEVRKKKGFGPPCEGFEVLVKVRYPKLPREGFPEELERVFHLAQKNSRHEHPEMPPNKGLHADR